MTDIDTAIAYYEEIANNFEKYKRIHCVTEYQLKKASQSGQIVEWLKELKAYREQDGDAISRQAAIDGADVIIARDTSGNNDVVKAMTAWKSYVEGLPPVTPQQKTAKHSKTQQNTGRWIPVGYDGYADGNPVYDWWECSECGWEHTGDEESLTAFCPNCGAKMEV